MNAIRSFYDTFRIFPFMMTTELFSNRRQATVAALFCATCGSALYAVTDSPVISVFVVLFLPEFLLRALLVWMTRPF